MGDLHWYECEAPSTGRRKPVENTLKAVLVKEGEYRGLSAGAFMGEFSDSVGGADHTLMQGNGVFAAYWKNGNR